MTSAPRTILVVDDNDRLAALVEKYLRREGFRTAVAAPARPPSTRLTARPSICSLLTSSCPDMTGEEFVRTLAEPATRPSRSSSSPSTATSSGPPSCSGPGPSIT